MYNLVHTRNEQDTSWTLVHCQNELTVAVEMTMLYPKKTSQQTTVIDAQCTKRSSIDIKIEVKEG
jgi:hypothetical protein